MRAGRCAAAHVGQLVCSTAAACATTAQRIARITPGNDEEHGPIAMPIPAMISAAATTGSTARPRRMTSRTCGRSPVAEVEDRLHLERRRRTDRSAPARPAAAPARCRPTARPCRARAAPPRPRRARRRCRRGTETATAAAHTGAVLFPGSALACADCRGLGLWWGRRARWYRPECGRTAGATTAPGLRPELIHALTGPIAIDRAGGVAAPAQRVHLGCRRCARW